MCVCNRIKLEPKATPAPEINPLDIIHDEQQNEKHAADQFFSSLLDFAMKRRWNGGKISRRLCRMDWVWVQGLRGAKRRRCGQEQARSGG
jgi:hypothetical protein